MDKPGEVANFGRGQLNRENEYFPVCPRSRLRILSRGSRSTVPSRAGLLILQTQAESGTFLAGFLPIYVTVFYVSCICY